MILEKQFRVSIDSLGAVRLSVERKENDQGVWCFKCESTPWRIQSLSVFQSKDHASDRKINLTLWMA